MSEQNVTAASGRDPAWERRYERNAFILMLLLFALMPMAIYPRFGSQLLCFAIFACAFNLLIGFGGLLSFGHAMFFGMSSYFCAHLAKMGLAIDVIKIKSITIPIGLVIPPFPVELAILGAVAA